MDSLEEMRKKFSIQKELLKHGLAKTSDEAIEKASVVMDGKVLSDKDIVEKSQVTLENEEMQSIHVDVRRMQSQLNNLLKEYHDTIEQIKARMDTIEHDYDKIRVGLERRSQPVQVQKPLVYGEEEPHHEERRTEERRVEEPRYAEPQSESEKNQRVGKFKPNDVDIQKMFYYGNK